MFCVKPFLPFGKHLTFEIIRESLADLDVNSELEVKGQWGRGTKSKELYTIKYKLQLTIIILRTNDDKCTTRGVVRDKSTAQMKQKIIGEKRGKNV